MTNLRKALLAGTVCVLASCTTTQQQADINALLGGSAASTMVSYLAGLDPQVSSILGNVDAAIAKNAPTVLAVACGGGSAANFVFKTAAILAPSVVTPTMLAQEGVAFGILTSNCPPNPPPTNLAAAAQAAWSAYQQVLAGTQSAGVVVPPAQAAASRRR